MIDPMLNDPQTPVLALGPGGDYVRDYHAADLSMRDSETPRSDPPGGSLLLSVIGLVVAGAIGFLLAAVLWLGEGVWR